MTTTHPNDYSPAELTAALAAMRATIETIRDVKRAPGGTLYAALMTTGMTLEGFAKMMGLIVATGLVGKDGDEYVWVGE